MVRSPRACDAPAANTRHVCFPPTGAGKTTLFRLFTGEESPSTGCLHVMGRDVAAGGLAAGVVGFVPQSDALVDFLTVGEHAELFARLRGVEGTEVQTVARAACVAVGISAFWGSPANRLSGGTRRKLSLACALVGAPPVLLLDEFTSGCDAVARRFLWGTLASLRERLPMAVVLSSHHMEDLQALCTKLVVMRRGRILAAGPPQALRDVHCAGYSLELHLERGGKSRIAAASVVERVAALLVSHPLLQAPANSRISSFNTSATVAAEDLAARATKRILGIVRDTILALKLGAAEPARLSDLEAALGPVGIGWAVWAALQAALNSSSLERQVLLDEAATAFACWLAIEERIDTLLSRLASTLPLATVVERGGHLVRLALPPGSFSSIGAVFRLVRSLQAEATASMVNSFEVPLKPTLPLIASFGLAQNTLDAVLERMMGDE